MNKDVVEEDETMWREATGWLEADDTRLAIPHHSPATLQQWILQRDATRLAIPHHSPATLQ